MLWMGFLWDFFAAFCALGEEEMVTDGFWFIGWVSD